MREWYDIEFVPNSALNKFKRCFVTDLLIGGKTFKQWKLEAYQEGYNDALRHMRSNIDELEEVPKKMTGDMVL